jgi:hypothetical protein
VHRDCKLVTQHNFSACFQIQEKPLKPTGIAIWQASIFIAAQIAGSGVLALPKAASDAGTFS